MNNIERIIELEKLVELLEVTIQRLLQENKEYNGLKNQDKKIISLVGNFVKN